MHFSGILPHTQGMTRTHRKRLPEEIGTPFAITTTTPGMDVDVPFSIYEVEGEPGRWVRRTGTATVYEATHTEVALWKVRVALAIQIVRLEKEKAELQVKLGNLEARLHEAQAGNVLAN